VIFSGLAIADSAQPIWNRSGASCSASYCHGGGTRLANDTAAGHQTPVWTLDGTPPTPQAFCGSCHGLPPVNGRHPGATFPNCSGCHPRTVTPGGAIIISGPPEARTSFHINGVVDVGP
ncbi:MAG TPA: CxxxxCH/CxxCH domain-containing protein, partial [Myxococcales bacterium]|nr:CxxxxCH/CxxCH domain-containing protein [Myxococcales bacterium]